LQGSENIFTIDPLLKNKMQKEMSDNQDTIKELKDEVRDLKKEITQRIQAIKDGTPAFLEIKKRLVHYKKSGVKLPSSFVKKYKQFTQLQEYLKGIKEEYNVKNDHLNLQTTKTASFQDNILDARVINRDKWMGYNEIKFKLVDPPIELVHRPAEGSKDMIFGLVEIGNGKFEIQAVEE
jgi:chromosome segregation ATPase